VCVLVCALLLHKRTVLDCSTVITVGLAVSKSVHITAIRPHIAPAHSTHATLDPHTKVRLLEVDRLSLGAECSSSRPSTSTG
jgi:hypothetical protein